MEKTFQTLNELETAGLVTRYAIGGAFATETAPRARASARFTVRQPDAPNPSSQLTSVGTLKRRESRAPTLPVPRLGLRPQPLPVPASRNSKPIEFDGFGNCGEFATIKNQVNEPGLVLIPSNSTGLETQPGTISFG